MRGPDAFQGNGNSARRALADPRHQIRKGQRLTLLAGQRLVQGIADEIATIDEQRCRRGCVTVGAIPREAEQSGGTADLDDAVKSLRLEFQQ